MKTLLVTQCIDGSTYDPKTEKHIPIHIYEVDKVTNAIHPKIHSRLSAAEVDGYCDADEWNVTIK